MKLKRNTVLDKDLDLSFLKAEGYKWAIVYNFDEVKIGRLDELEIDGDILLQARIFNEDKELNIVREKHNLNLCFLEEDSDDECIEDSYLIIENKFKNYKNINIKKYINYDDDGQAFISYVRPYGLIF